MKLTWGIWQIVPSEMLGAIGLIPSQGPLVMSLEEDIDGGSSGRDSLAQSGRLGAYPRGGLGWKVCDWLPLPGVHLEIRKGDTHSLASKRMRKLNILARDINILARHQGQQETC